MTFIQNWICTCGCSIGFHAGTEVFFQKTDGNYKKDFGKCTFLKCECTKFQWDKNAYKNGLRDKEE